MNGKENKDEFVAQDDTYCNSYDVYRRGLLEQQKTWVSKQIIPLLSGCLNSAGYKILGIGSGEGDVDMLLLEEIIAELDRKNMKCEISYTVIERNGSFISRFKNRVEEKRDSLNHVKFSWHQGTFEEVISITPLSKYDLVHFAHSLYYMDAEKALEYCMSNLVLPGGCVMSVVQTEESIYAKNCRKFKGNIAHCFDGFQVLSGEELESIAAKHGWKCHTEIGKRILDLTDILGEKLRSLEGSKLFDFFFHADNLLKTLENGKLEEILDHFRANSSFENGKYLSIGNEAIVCFFKDV